MDDLLFIDDDEATPPEAAAASGERGWLVLIVDDDMDVHRVTEMALRHFRFQGRPLRFVDCYRGSEALAILPTLPDLALILLDVVMEQTESGIDVARAIRDARQYDAVQIVVLTAAGGYCGRAGFRDIPIHAFMWKSESSKHRLETVVTEALAAHCAARHTSA